MPSYVEVIKYHLDLFYNQLLTEPNAQAYLIFYRGRRGSLTQNQSYAKNYLDLRGGLLSERIKAVYGGYRENPTMELWIVPGGAEFPKPTPTYRPKRHGKY